MSNEVNETKYYFPWVRKGLKEGITETDTLGGDSSNNNSLNKQRSSILITAEYNVTPPEGDSVLSVSMSKEIHIVGPGDILNVSSNAVLRTVPVNRSFGFDNSFYPYIEFWEPDFPWRYTPAIPNSDPNHQDYNKLRPWLALLVCKSEDCKIESVEGRPYVRFNICDEEQYKRIFPDPREIWKAAHAQGTEQPNPENTGATRIVPEFSRIIALRRKNPETGNPQEKEKYNLEEGIDYLALLVPSFETGRLRGLGYDDDELKDIISQKSAWENDYNVQKNKQRAFDFPVYYQWRFQTGKNSFSELVKNLKLVDEFKSEIKVDVSRMGEGFDYNMLREVADDSERRNVIGIPAATRTVDETRTPFPSRSINDEIPLYENLKTLIDNNPVFAENRAEITDKPYDEVDDDDPWVTPPVYGAKHIMATGINDLEAGLPQQSDLDAPPQWLSQVNLDINYRAIAGLGKRTVQVHQEEFVNRAWKQVEAVNALNHELYKRLVSVNASDALKNKVLSPDGEEYNAQYLARLMRYLGSMKNAHSEGGLSLNDILKNNNIPTAFATASFQHLTDELVEKLKLSSATLMENIAENQTFSNMPNLDHSLTNIRQLYKFNFPYTFVAAVSDGNDNEVTDGKDSKIWEKISHFFTVERKTDTSNNIKRLYTLVPKRISHAVADENNPDCIFAPNYKLKRYHDFFKEATKSWEHEGYDDKRQHPLGYSSTAKSPLGKIREVKSTNFFSGFKLQSDFFYRDIYDRMDEFLNSENIKHRSYGYANTANDKRVNYLEEKKVSIGINNYIGPQARPPESLGNDACNTRYSYNMERRYYTKEYGEANVIVLSDKEFNEIFSLGRSMKTIIRVGGENGYYFVPMRVVKSHLFNRDAVRSFVHLPDSFSSEDINDDNYIEAQVVYVYDSYRYNEENIKCIETVDFSYGNTGTSQSISAVASSLFDKPAYIPDDPEQEDKTYYGVPVLVDPAPALKTTNHLFTGNFGKYCYSPIQLYHPLMWRIFEMWREDSDNDLLYTTLINYIRPVWGISPVQPANKDPEKLWALLMVRYTYNDCSECSKQRDCKLTHNSPECFEEQAKSYYECQRKISEYLFEQPDHVEVDIEEFKRRGGKVIHYDTGHEFAYYFLWHLRYKPVEQPKFNLFKPWHDLFLQSRELNEKINRIQWERQSPKPTAKDVMVEWQKSADHSELYERMREVAETYYTEFFDISSGEELREKYITELLHSKYPAMAYPIFPEPAYYYLKMFSDKFIIPSVDQIPEDSVAMFLSNEAFTEAYLCGMNTEMGRELLWREYPTDQRGSYFRKFWDSEATPQDIHNENFFDVAPLHTWTGELGTNHMEFKTGLMFFAFKGKLMRQFPSTQVFLHKAEGTYNAATGNGTTKFKTPVLEKENVNMPVIQAHIREDILLVGFKINFDDALGNPERNDFGYFLAFMEDVQDLNFKDGYTENIKDAADAADALINKPTLYGKHLSLFTNVK